MPDLVVVDGAKIQFEPGPGWQWVNWDGQVTLKVPHSIVQVAGYAVASEADFVTLGASLAGKSYKATGFEDTPGAITQATVKVNVSTLSRVSSFTDQPVATEQSTGIFNAVCMPSVKIGTPPVPDPLCGARVGRWRVVNPGQTIFQTD